MKQLLARAQGKGRHMLHLRSSWGKLGPNFLVGLFIFWGDLAPGQTFGLASLAEQYLAHQVITWEDDLPTAPLAEFKGMEDAPATRALQRWTLLQARPMAEEAVSSTAQAFAALPVGPAPAAKALPATNLYPQSAAMIQQIFQEGILGEAEAGLALQTWPAGLHWPQVSTAQIQQFYKCLRQVQAWYPAALRGEHLALAKVNQYRARPQGFFCTHHLGLAVNVASTDEWWNLKFLAAVPGQKAALGFFLNAYAQDNTAEGKKIMELTWQLIYQAWASAAASDVLAPGQLKAFWQKNHHGQTDFQDMQALALIRSGLDYLQAQGLLAAEGRPTEK
jgi:hypothetical protein